jgi:leucyl aminopeptidase
MWTNALNYSGFPPSPRTHLCLLCVQAGRPGGAITAALFLAEFISPGTTWAHIDMAGPAWDPAAGLGTGYGAATLGNWLLSQQRL